jgi:hypothetical protein
MEHGQRSGGQAVITGFPHVMENLENKKFIFQVLKYPGILQYQEMSRKCPGKIFPVRKLQL